MSIPELETLKVVAVAAAAILVCAGQLLLVFQVRELRRREQQQGAAIRNLRRVLNAGAEQALRSRGQWSELRTLVGNLLERQNSLEEKAEERASASYAQAQRLLDSGAPPESVARRCGLSRGEAELLAALRQLPAEDGRATRGRGAKARTGAGGGLASRVKTAETARR